MYERTSTRRFLMRRDANGRRAPLARLLWVAGALLALGACMPSHRAVPIDSRPTPLQPGSTDTTALVHPNGTQRPPSPESRRDRIVQDTLSTHATLERCAKRRLLPEQESTMDSVRQLLAETQLALVGEDLARAESLARRALQLSRSLSCP
jgi:hypothetical protein